MSRIIKRVTDGTTITDSSHDKSYFLATFRENTTINTVLTINVNTLIAIPNPTISFNSNSDFTFNSLGSDNYQLEYTPSDGRSRFYKADMWIRMFSVASNNQKIQFSLGYTPSSGSETIGTPFLEMRASVTNANFTSSFTMIELNSGDKLNIYAKNISSSDNIEIAAMRLSMVEI